MPREIWVPGDVHTKSLFSILLLEVWFMDQQDHMDQKVIIWKIVGRQNFRPRPTPAESESF